MRPSKVFLGPQKLGKKPRGSVRFYLPPSLAAALVLIAPITVGASDEAFILIRATVTQEEHRQPTWIAFCPMNRRNCLHVPADGWIHAIEEGTFYIDHIDFQENPNSGRGSASFRNSTVLKIEVGNIYVFGHIKMSRKESWNDYGITLEVDIDLFMGACASSPEVFSLYPVTSLLNSDKFRFACKFKND